MADYFKVWFANAATLYDPATGQPITDDNPQSAWQKLIRDHEGKTALITFPINKPDKLSWEEVLRPLSAQGYTRVLRRESGKQGVESGENEFTISRIDDLLTNNSSLSTLHSPLLVVQDRIAILNNKARSRAIEALQTAFHFGQGQIELFDDQLKSISGYIHGLRSPETGQSFRPASPALFSFNSPIGACAECRGFGRIIEIDERLVIPDHSLSIDDGAIRAFQGEVYSESLRDLQRAARKHKIRTNIECIAKFCGHG